MEERIKIVSDGIRTEVFLDNEKIENLVDIYFSHFAGELVSLKLGIQILSKKSNNRNNNSDDR